jgi:hypothetical protein
LVGVGKGREWRGDGVVMVLLLWLVCWMVLSKEKEKAEEEEA